MQLTLRRVPLSLSRPAPGVPGPAFTPMMIS